MATFKPISKREAEQFRLSTHGWSMERRVAVLRLCDSLEQAMALLERVCGPLDTAVIVADVPDDEELLREVQGVLRQWNREEAGRR